MEEHPQPSPPQYVRVSAPTVTPYVTYVLLGITVLAYLLQLAGNYLLGGDLLLAIGVKYAPYIRAGEVWRLITPVFLHASILHIGFNMYALFIYGRELEARFGHLRFTSLYFLSAFAGNVLSFLLTPSPSLGASTAIFGLLAAEGMFLFQNRKLLGGAANRIIGNIVLIAVFNLMLGFTATGIDNYGHIGGLLGGILFTWFGGPRWKVEGLYPSLYLTDEREGHGLWAGITAVLLFFVPLAILGWIWPVN
jgi:rhomboid protease GluP